MEGGAGRGRAGGREPRGGGESGGPGGSRAGRGGPGGPRRGSGRPASPVLIKSRPLRRETATVPWPTTPLRCLGGFPVPPSGAFSGVHALSRHGAVRRSAGRLPARPPTPGVAEQAGRGVRLAPLRGPFGPARSPASRIHSGAVDNRNSRGRDEGLSDSSGRSGTPENRMRREVGRRKRVG